MTYSNLTSFNKQRYLILRLGFLAVFSFLFTSVIYAQQDESTYQQLHMLLLKQENDLYQYKYKSDKNYTDGIHIELFHRMFNNRPANWFLIGFRKTAFKDFSFSILKQAQSAGDFESLQKHDRRVLKISIGKDVNKGIKQVIKEFRKVL